MNIDDTNSVISANSYNSKSTNKRNLRISTKREVVKDDMYYDDSDIDESYQDSSISQDTIFQEIPSTKSSRKNRLFIDIDDSSADEYENDSIDVSILPQAIIDKVSEVFMRHHVADFPGIVSSKFVRKRENIDFSKYDERLKKDNFGLNLSKLKNWSNENQQSLMTREEALQETAIKQVRKYVSASGKLGF